MKASHTRFRRAALCIALGACFASTAPLVFAQSVTGGVAGRASAGDQITITNAGTGFSRSVSVGSEGAYRLSQLPVGDYMLTVSRGGQQVGEPITVSISLGGTTNVNLGADGGLVNMDAVQVVGSRVVNRVDVRSTESATNVRREELARLPVDQSLGSVALLAPGVMSSASTFGGLSFGGSSVAENAVYINGLNVTDPYRRQGYSTVPFGFYEEFQVKTGGYSAEFGRTTGGVINAVTRSGSNEFKGGAQVTLEPSAWGMSARDQYRSDGTIATRDRTTRDTSSFYKTNVWASGPIVRDRLFFFAMYENRDSNGKDIDTTRAAYSRSDNDFWGAKLDWRINDDHLLELLAFSDQADSVTSSYRYGWDTTGLGAWTGDSSGGSGGDSWSLTYTARFGENFVAKAMHGVNERSALSGSPLDGACSIVTFSSGYAGQYGLRDSEGCHPTNSSVSTRYDKRAASRLDFEWTLGNHQLRFGVEQEIMDSNSSVVYPGDGRSYQAQTATPGGLLPNGALIPDGVTRIIDARHYITGSPIRTDTQAFYIEDNWNVTPNLLLNLGLRFDQFHNKLASGGTFAKRSFSDMMGPRVGFSWDMREDGSTKLFGNAGRYYLPLTNKLADYFGGGTTDEHTYYALNGWIPQSHPVTGSPYLMPDLGPQIGPVNTDGNVPAPDDIRTEVARDLKMVYQDEFILGFQQAINAEWSYGINATYREVSRAVEDVRINSLAGCPGYSSFPIINPGERNTLWCESTNDWVEFDSSSEGYVATGSGARMGYKPPRRTYKAVEFQLDRAWNDKWALNASYLWSKSEGNIEGPVNSDTGYADTNLVQFYDHPAVNERHGVLFNDSRHQIKLRGSYKLNETWSFGSTVSARSGGPITAFGVVWPNDNRAMGPGEFNGGGSGWLCTAECSSWQTRQLVYSERGAFGRMPWVYDVGANVTWTLPVDGIDLKARLSVYNLLNRQTVINVHSRYEAQPGTPMPYFGQGRAWQSPRYTQLVVTWNF